MSTFEINISTSKARHTSDLIRHIEDITFTIDSKQDVSGYIQPMFTKLASEALHRLTLCRLEDWNICVGLL